MAFLNYDGLKRYNKKIKEYIEDKIKGIDVDKFATKTDLDTKADKSQLFSGDYNDLQNLPVIPDTTNLATKNELKNHTDDANIHVTSTEKNTWNNKLDNSALTPYATQSYVTNEINKATSAITVDLTPYAKKVDVDNKLANKADKTEIPNISNLATKDELKNHTDDSDIHVTSSEKNAWNAKIDNSALTPYAKTTEVDAKLDTKVDKADGYSLISDTEIDRLKNVDNYDDTDVKADIADIKTSLDSKLESTDLDDINAHVSNTSIHITAEERAKWNAKIDDSDLVEYEKTSDVNIKLNSKANTTDLNTHTGNTDIHVTSDEKTKWDSKLDSNALTPYAKKVDVNANLNNKVDKVVGKSLVDDAEIARLATINNYNDTDIKNTLNSKANTTDLNAHTGNTDIHVTSNEKTKWDSKLDSNALTGYATETFVTTKITEAATSGKVDLTGYAKTVEVDNKLASKADKTEIPDISNLATKDELSTHTDNSSIHVTANDKNNWNNKLDTSALDAYTTTDDLNSALALKANKDELFSGDYNDLANKPTIPDTSNLATKGQLDSHISNATMHVTADDKNKWNAKLDNTALNGYATETFVTEKITEAATSGTVDLSGYAKTADVNASLDTKVDKVSGKSLVSDTEIERLKNVDNYDDSSIKTSITNINSKLDTKANKSDLFSKSYNDLTDKPTIPSLDGYAKLTDIPDITGKADKTYVDTKLDTKANKSELFSKSYNDLTDKPTIPSLDGYAKTTDVNASLDTKVDKVDGKVLSTNDYTTEEKTKVSKIVTSGDGSKFLANDGTYKKVSSSSASAVAQRKFKPVFGFDTYWGEMRDNHGNKNQVDLETIKQQIDQCEEMHVDRIICTIHIGWDETTNSLVIAENTDSILTAISYCADKNVTIDTAKVHVHFKGNSTSEKDYLNNVIGMSTFQPKYKAMLTTICDLFKDTTVTRIIIMNEMWYITDAKYGYSSFINECLNIVKSAGYATGLSMAGFATNLQLPDAVIQNIDTFYVNVYPGISGFGSYITKQEAIEAFEQCDIDLWIEKTKKLYPNKKIVISEMGVDDYWENLAAPSTWYINGTSKTGGHAVDTYITAMMEFFTNKNVDIEELWWWYNLYYEPVKETLLNYLGGDK